MSLQTQNLVMTGLGILNDVPPNAIQPGIADGKGTGILYLTPVNVYCKNATELKNIDQDQVGG
jgi:hypothetical protein